MKYNSNNQPLVCMMTNSSCYKGTSKMTIRGVLWHCTGANNPNLKRYVQPSDNAPDKAMLLAKIGINTNHNDWNHKAVDAGLNAWIGKLADGTVAAVQTMPWDYKPWGCGSGPKGSCNNGWIQFEMCEDNLANASYFNQVYQEACQLTAYLCKRYNLNPTGTVTYAGEKVPVILCHQDSYKLGLGSNHADVYNWFNKYGKTMEDVRKDVLTIMNNSTTTTQTPTATPSQPVTTQRNLKKGYKGADVKQLQKNLIALGYGVGPSGADGDFGNNTYNAVLRFQKDHNLTRDGIVGPQTRNAIETALKNKNNTPMPTPSVPAQEIYRIRKDWSNSKSQVGAYKNLNNAIKACKNFGSEYKVYNSKGEQIYPEVSKEIPVVDTPTKKEEKSVEIPAPIIIEEPKAPEKIMPARTYNNVMIGSSSKDERGQYHGGQAGDQTGKEVYILNWYDGKWTKVLRPTTNLLAENIAVACEKACDNNYIGYNQYNRNSIYTEAKKVGLDLSKINTPCDCDCSSLVSMCCISAGLSPDIFFAGNNMRVTGNLVQACEKTNQFTVLSSPNYTNSKDYLKRGDILLADGHTVIVLANGSKAGQIAPVVVIAGVRQVEVTATKLNVRSGPSTSNALVTQVTKGTKLTIIEEKGGWGKLKSGIGWIALEYTKNI